MTPAGRGEPPGETATAGSGTASARPPTASTSTAAAPTSDGDRRPTSLEARGDAEFARLVRELSEPTGEFLSDNVVSNETSYLQAASALRAVVRPGMGYVGVGPEQNFTYLALTRPADAFVVDLRRGNLLLHLLYKAAFERARDRSQFLALLFGRRVPAAEDDRTPATAMPLAAMLDRIEAEPPSEGAFAEAHELLTGALARFELGLDERDGRALEALHRRFWKEGPQQRFAMKAENGRRYPTLRELLLAVSPEGEALGFLASDEDFRFVRDLERANRVVPLVGNFAGGKALRGVAEELHREGIVVGAHYVSNVEQYLLGTPNWTPWVANVARLPRGPDAVFVRAYLDQGTRHPAQLPGHRTATVLQNVDRFLARSGRYRSMLELASDGPAPASPSTASRGNTAGP